MKLTVGVLLLVAVAVESSRSKEKTEGGKTEKRALLEGNSGVAKRTPLLATALPSVTPGIVYADSKDIESEKSPQQQIYATPVPQLAKISDVLTGQGPPFQVAIASHLFAPVSVYQTRMKGEMLTGVRNRLFLKLYLQLGSQTYQVSAPVASQLAYSERVYQPSAEQFNPQIFKQKPNLRFTIQPQANQYQQLTFPQSQLPPQIFQIPPNQNPNQPQIIQLTPNQPAPQLISYPQPYQQPLFYNQYQSPALTPPNFIQNSQQQIYQNVPVQSGVVYAEGQRPAQREQKTEQTTPALPLKSNLQERPQQQNYNSPNQGAFSFASFSVGPPAQNLNQYQPQQNQAQNQQVQYQQNPNHGQYQAQIQNQIQPLQAEQYQPQIQQYRTQASPQIQQYHIQRLPVLQHYNNQPQNQIRPQVPQKQEPSPANSVAVSSKHDSLSHGKESPYPQQNLYQPQQYEAQQVLVQNPYGNPNFVPTFPPVQFFGKYAHELFKQYQQ